MRKLSDLDLDMLAVGAADYQDRLHNYEHGRGYTVRMPYDRWRVLEKLGLVEARREATLRGPVTVFVTTSRGRRERELQLAARRLEKDQAC